MLSKLETAIRAVVLRDGRLEVRETPDPVPGHGELLLRTLGTAICASDVHYMDHPELVTNDGTGRFVYDPDRDIVMGHEFVGEVVARGPGCSVDPAERSPFDVWRELAVARGATKPAVVFECVGAAGLIQQRSASPATRRGHRASSCTRTASESTTSRLGRA